MKYLSAPGTVQSCTPLPRATKQPRSTGRPPCFYQIWLDCSAQNAYYVFSDGSIYRYGFPSANPARAIITATCLGQTFNCFYRRSYGGNPSGQFARVLTVPITASLAYQNPPYRGTDPGPCPLLNWDLLVWSNYDSYVSPGSSVFVPISGGNSNMASVRGNVTGTSNQWTAIQTGTMSYKGPAANCVANFIFTASAPWTSWTQFFIVIESTTTIFAEYKLANYSPGEWFLPFVVPDTGGLTETLFVVLWMEAAQFPLPVLTGEIDLTLATVS